MFHLTDDGPKPCVATKRACRLGPANHFSSEEAAQVAFEARLEAEIKPARISKRDMYSKSKKTLVLSDVDGTIVDGSLVLEHAVFLHQEGEIDLGDLPDRWLADQKNESLISELAESYRRAIVGRHLRELRINEYMGKVMEKEKFYTSLKRLERHRDSGHDVILVSGSPSFLVKDFAKRFGFQGIGTTYHTSRERRINGRITPMFHAAAKQAVVEKIDPSTYDLVVAYGDTASDKPLFDAAHHSVLVAPTKETLEKVPDVSEIIHE